MSEREWLPDPTGRHQFRARYDDGWTDAVAASRSGDGWETDAEGGREARAADSGKRTDFSLTDEKWKLRWPGFALIAVILAVGVGVVLWNDYQGGQNRYMSSADAADGLAESVGGRTRSDVARSPRKVEVCWSGTDGAVDVTIAHDGSYESVDSLSNNQCLSQGNARGYMSFSVQAAADKTMDVECEIRVDGRVVKSASSSGRFAVAGCTASL